jgi:hypothetical protein
MGSRHVLTAMHRQRGQTLPFWTLAVIATLALTFFIANYTNTVRWQIRAQTAADNAATAAIATDANVNNEVTLYLYAAAIEETRLRYLIQALMDNVYGVGCTSPTTDCPASYNALRTAITASAQRYHTLVRDLTTIDYGNVWDGQLENSPDLAVSLFQSGSPQADCATFDCNFAYSFTPITGQGNATVADVVTCHNVPTLAAALLGPAVGGTFQAVGHSAMTLQAVSETFHPGTPNPNTPGANYQPNWSPLGTNPPLAYTVDFSTLAASLTWYTAGPSQGQAYPQGPPSCQ